MWETTEEKKQGFQSIFTQEEASVILKGLLIP